MEYFKEKNGKYYASLGGKNQNSSRAVSIAVTAIPFIIFGVVYFNTVKADGGPSVNTPMIAAAAILIIVNLFAFFLRKIGVASGIVVDQMERIISFRRPGTQKKSMSLDSVQKISLKVNYGKAASLNIVTPDGKNYLLLASADVQMMRQLADELSTLISLTVDEEPFQ
ncbi:MAG: hypothetical protein J7K88_03385 [Candidatus Fermentibacteraceae bacterium]|nr:hypothetical protein [Candidatus Fermentibacteraceae bacterium]